MTLSSKLFDIIFYILILFSYRPFNRRLNTEKLLYLLKRYGIKLQMNMLVFFVKYVLEISVIHIPSFNYSVFPNLLPPKLFHPRFGFLLCQENMFSYIRQIAQLKRYLVHKRIAPAFAFIEASPLTELSVIWAFMPVALSEQAVNRISNFARQLYQSAVLDHIF